MPRPVFSVDETPDRSQIFIVPRDQSFPPGALKSKVEEIIALGSVDMRLIKVGPRSGVARVEIPTDKLEQVRELLGSDFMIDLNGKLSSQRPRR